ncbi:superfamily II DNA/RNA helicase [Azospirillum lipoferum]|uniref:DEAD-box ATP-dependent RNA helicase RhpA n=1 Tax=Azospirillum lipoferum TaxID=193 RepID=A0A5A9GW76_AZOLI|nr:MULTISPECIES: DEAD/DEAH box helicase [Azospirillum]KAA0598686.1 DEAD/DEAH box helicase [Azospirillum lipoferum]MCP1609291.1 superfamily II DNA/RNA helicase [Azospirillum lipoferum]MDW5535399.1 DEAD/DEAH box helicase [Azospirillum sp. NL1]
MLFSELGLGPDVLRAIEDKGYTQPTPIQEQAIPCVLQRRDVLGCAQTGTGKTASFTLPMIDILASGRARARMPRSLILEPTRELAAQVSESFETYGKYHKLSMALLIGGETFTEQVKKLDRGVDVLIATPGRLIDLFERGNIMLNDIKVFVIDEADRMLDMGFIPDIERIVSKLPKNRQTLFFSATMPPEIRRLADAFLTQPLEISVAPPASPAETVTQAMVLVHDMDKRKALRHLLQTEDVKNAFIFCNRKRDIAVLQKSLERHGFNVGALHGDMVQSKRTETLERFKQGEITLLVCSDVAARGIDVQGLSHVFNFDVPLTPDDYVHRIGRTGRAGKQGRAFMLATPDDTKLVGAITRLIKREIPMIAIDGLETAEFGEEDSSSSRGRGRGRGGRGAKPESRSEGRPPRGGREERAPREEAAPREERPARDERPVREDRPVREERQPRESLAAAESRRNSEPRRDRDRGDRRRRRDDDDDDVQVIGFGDHMPAFMLRSARPRPSTEASTEPSQEG